MKILFGCSIHRQGWHDQIRTSLAGTDWVPLFEPFTPEAMAAADLLFPLHMEEILALAEDPDVQGKSLLPSRATLLTANHKLRFNAFLERQGFTPYLPKALPRSQPVYPCVLKGDTGEWGVTTAVLRSVDDLTAHAEWLARDDFYLQEYVSSSMDSSLHVMFDGERIRYAATSRRRYDQHIFLMNSDYAPVEAELTYGAEFEDVFTRVLRRLDYRGVACFDYRIRDGRPLIFELNPRLGASMAGAVHQLLPAMVAILGERNGC